MLRVTWWLALAWATSAAVRAAWSAVGLPHPGAIVGGLVFYGTMYTVLAAHVRHHLGAPWSDLLPLRGVAVRLVVPVALASLGGLVLAYQAVHFCEALDVLPPLVVDLAPSGVPGNGPAGDPSLLEALVAYGVMSAVFEEALFRGLVLRTLAATMSERRAIVLSALFFAVAHFGIERTPHTFLLGLLYGWLFVRTGSLLPGMLAHALHNSSCVVLAWMNLSPGSVPGVKLDEYGLMPAWAVCVAAALVVVGVMGVRWTSSRHAVEEPHPERAVSGDVAA